MKKWLFGLLLLMRKTYADSGVGGVAANLMEPVAFAADFIYTGCFMLGAAFLFASLVKYIEHRRNEFAVPIGTVVFLLIAGILLLALPFAYLLTNHSSPYRLYR